ncbi:hypothetical protein pb186bvf_014281 [Paramecium bursaria]
MIKQMVTNQLVFQNYDQAVISEDGENNFITYSISRVKFEIIKQNMIFDIRTSNFQVKAISLQSCSLQECLQLEFLQHFIQQIRPLQFVSHKINDLIQYGINKILYQIYNILIFSLNKDDLI